MTKIIPNQESPFSCANSKRDLVTEETIGKSEKKDLSETFQGLSAGRLAGTGNVKKFKYVKLLFLN